MEAVPQPHENLATLLLAGRVSNPLLAAFTRQFKRVAGRSGCVKVESGRRIMGLLYHLLLLLESLRLEPVTNTPPPHKLAPAAGFLTDLVTSHASPAFHRIRRRFRLQERARPQRPAHTLDHEVIHWGDPAFDLGFSMTHLLSKARHLLGLAAAISRAMAQYFGVRTARRWVRALG